MNTLIHIGFPKAASTWLQQSLFPAARNITFVKESVVSEKLLKPGSFVFNSPACRNFFLTQYNEPLLLSDERFLGSFNLGWNNGAYTKELSGRLKEVFPEADILMVIRNQPDIIASAYAQYVKDGGTIPINKYLYPPENFTFQNILKFSFEHLEYDRIINYFDNLFPGKVKVLLFEELQDDPSAFIQRLRTELGLEIEESNINYNPYNQRYNNVILTLARWTNIFTRNGSLNKYYIIHIPGFHSFSKRIWNSVNRFGILGKPGSTMKILGKENYYRICSYYTESNRKLEKYVPIRFIKKYNYPS